MKHAPPLAFAAALILLTSGCSLYLDEDVSDDSFTQPDNEPDNEPEDSIDDPNNDLVIGTPSMNCESIVNEGLWCTSFERDSTLVAIGMESGNSCNMLTLSSPVELSPSSIGVLGISVYACDPVAERAVGLPLLGGIVQIVEGIRCEAVTSWNDGLLASDWSDPRNLQWYPSFAALAAGQPDQTLTVPDLWASRLAIDGDRLYAAWHSTDTVQVFSLPDGTNLGDIALEGHDGWIHGMDVVDGQLYVLDRENNILVFDAATGAAQDTIPYGISSFSSLGGLQCFSNLAT